MGLLRLREVEALTRVTTPAGELIGRKGRRTNYDRHPGDLGPTSMLGDLNRKETAR